MATAQAEKKVRNLEEEKVAPQKRFKQPPKKYTNRGADKRSSGNYTSELINPKFASQVQLQRMDLKDGPLWWRAYPMVAPETEDVLLPTREDEEDEHGYRAPTDWMVLAQVAAGVGIDTWKTFMLSLPSTLEGADGSCERNNPYSTFFWNAYNSSPENKKHPQRATFRDKWRPAWTALMKGETGKGAPMKKPGKIAIIRGELWQLGEKNYLAGEGGEKGYPLGRRAGDPLQLLACSSSATQALNHMLRKTDAPLDEETGKPIGTGKLLFPEIVGTISEKTGRLVNGRFLQFFNPAINPGPAYCKPEDSSWRGEVRDPPWHQLRVRKEFPLGKELLTPVIGENGINNLTNKAYPWWPSLNDDGQWEQTGVLYYPTDEEMVLFIAQCFSTQGALLDYALFAEHPEWRTADIKAILKQRTQAAKPSSGDDDDEEPSSKKKGKASPGHKAHDMEEGEETEEEENEEPEENEDEDEDQPSARAAQDDDEEEDEETPAKDEDEEEEDEFAPEDEDEEEEEEEESDEADEKLDEAEFEESVLSRKDKADGKPAGKKAAKKPDAKPASEPPAKKSKKDEYDEADEELEREEQTSKAPPKKTAAASNGKKPTKKVPPKKGRAGKK